VFFPHGKVGRFILDATFETHNTVRKDISKFVSNIADQIGLDGRVGGDLEAKRRIEERKYNFYFQSSKKVSRGSHLITMRPELTYELVC
jgi:hypothetical protein